MILYLYKLGTNTPALTIEDARSYTADSVTAEDGAVYRPLEELVAALLFGGEGE